MVLVRMRQTLPLVQWAAPQPTPICQNITMELEPHHVVIKLKIDQINLTVRGRLMCCPLYYPE